MLRLKDSSNRVWGQVLVLTASLTHAYGRISFCQAQERFWAQAGVVTVMADQLQLQLQLQLAYTAESVELPIIGTCTG